MRSSVIAKKIKKRFDKLRYQPIEVFVFHSVSDMYEKELCVCEDWTSTEDFKKYMQSLKKEYRLVSLAKVYSRLRVDWIRKKEYVALTCDDGFASIMKILPFLEEQEIPVTLFVNPKYLDGKSKREGYAENPQYITKEELWNLTSPLISIGMHGYEHNDATKMTKDEFAESVDKCIDILQSHPRYIPFYAYTWGKYSDMTQLVLKEKKIVPVLTDGESNYRFRQGISRKPIDSYYLKRKIR